ncbi:MAG: PEP-CTERM sorting domain-containing protein [Verrucomicrobiae bacterium]|nr:PEP-CTERM sorting domain-containing protein [Verrucomicrobiae bacterium]
MNGRIPCLAAAVWLALFTLAHGQGAFQNLDFENGVFVPSGGSSFLVEAESALPGWTAFVGTNQLTEVLHNTGTISSLAQIAIYGPDEPQAGLFHGQYYVILRGGEDPFGGPGTVGAALAQTGTIPGSAQSIQFFFASGGISLFFAGQQIPLSVLGSAPTGDIYGGDVSAFAGQTGELRFRGDGFLDNIQFSSEPVPEPGTVVLFTLGALLLGGRFLWRRKC